MKLSVIICLVVVQLSLSFAGTKPRESRIIGGHDASPRSHPYLASLQMRFLWARLRICSGSLLSDRWILTAGHCVKGSWLMNWLTMEAVLGTNNIEVKESSAQIVKISDRIPHPNYNGDIGPYDIAMLKTAKSITYTSAVAPIEVPFSMGSFTHRTQHLVLAGWGALETTSFIPPLPDTLQEASVELLPFDECKKAIDDVEKSSEDNPLDRAANICTGPITGGTAACSGDSGGPLIQYISYNSEELVSETEEPSTVAPVLTTLNPISNDIFNTGGMDPTDQKVGTQATEGFLVGNSIEDTAKPTRSGRRTTNIVKIYNDQGLIPVVIGVVSWGISPCGEVGAPTVYTNVSAYSDFIYKHLYN